MKRALTRTQASEVLRAAALLPPGARDQFLAAVDARLIAIPHRLNDGDVSAAIIAALATTPQQHLFCDAQPEELTMTQQHDADFDERGLLRDGHRMRVPLQMCDSYQRDVAQHFADRRRADARRFDDHRPGERRLTDAAGFRRKEEAYREMVDDMCNAWRTPADSGEHRGAQPGDECTINGQAGHLNARLQCVPDRQRRQDSAPRTTMTMDESQKIKDQAWQQMVDELTSAWKTR